MHVLVRHRVVDRDVVVPAHDHAAVAVEGGNPGIGVHAGVLRKAKIAQRLRQVVAAHAVVFMPDQHAEIASGLRVALVPVAYVFPALAAPLPAIRPVAKTAAAALRRAAPAVIGAFVNLNELHGHFIRFINLAAQHKTVASVFGADQARPRAAQLGLGPVVQQAIGRSVRNALLEARRILAAQVPQVFRQQGRVAKQRVAPVQQLVAIGRAHVAVRAQGGEAPHAVHRRGKRAQQIAPKLG